MLPSVVMLGLLALLGLAVWRLSAATGDPTPGRPSARDAEGGGIVGDAPTPSDALGGDRTLANALVVAAAALATTAGALLVTLLLYDPAVGVAFKGAAVGGLLLGVTGVGQFVAVRLGIRPTPPATPRRSLSAAVGHRAARAFGRLRAADGDGDLDDATLGVLAAATAGAELDGVLAWGERSGVVTPDRLGDRVEALSRAGVVTVDGDRIRLADPVGGSGADRVVALAAAAV